MQFHFDSTRQDLADLVEAQGIDGRWQSDGEGSRFTTDEGGILIWYGRQYQTVLFQGKEPARSTLRAALAKHFGGSGQLDPAH
ncbi:MAG: hypothetical protein K8T26_12475 [Lentisphaerae bacterium]|nr:hypothetical protein [Lentisphaerota bacterium]